MPNATLSNPAGLNGESAYGSQTIIDVENGDTDSLAIGTLVQLSDFDGTGAIKVVPQSKTANDLLLGVVVNLDIAAGAVGQVCTQGVAQILCDATTTKEDPLIQSTSTAGAGKTGTAVTNQTIGTALQAVTISSGTALVWAYINKS